MTKSDIKMRNIKKITARTPVVTSTGGATGGASIAAHETAPGEDPSGRLSSSSMEVIWRSTALGSSLASAALTVVHETRPKKSRNARDWTEDVEDEEPY